MWLKTKGKLEQPLHHAIIIIFKIGTKLNKNARFEIKYTIHFEVIKIGRHKLRVHTSERIKNKTFYHFF